MSLSGETFTDAEAARLRTSCRWLMGVTGPLFLLATWLRLAHGPLSERWAEDARDAWDGLPFTLGFVFLVAVILRWTRAEHLRADFATAIRERERLLRQLAAELAGDLRVERHEGRVEGRLGDAQVHVSAWLDPTSTPEQDTLTCTLVATSPWRAVARRRPQQALYQAPLLERLDLTGMRRPPLGEALARALIHVFEDLHAREVVLDERGLTATLPANARSAAPEHVCRVLTELRGLADRLGAELGPALAPTTAVEVSAAPRTASDMACPYCRAPAADGEARTCEDCETVHHVACWTDHGGCSVAGCRGGPPLARQRAR